MSVLIKGMEMPKNCLACKLRGEGSDARYIWDCPFTEFEYTREEGETGRLDECPLVEISEPHGRLIDADRAEKLLQQAKDKVVENGEILRSFAVGFALGVIAKEPTVIEGSEDE